MLPPLTPLLLLRQRCRLSLSASLRLLADPPRCARCSERHFSRSACACRRKAVTALAALTAAEETRPLPLLLLAALCSLRAGRRTMRFLGVRDLECDLEPLGGLLLALAEGAARGTAPADDDDDAAE